MANMGRSVSQFLKSQIRNYSAPLDSSIPASKQKYVPSSGTYPRGFKVSGTHVGVKPSNTRFPDLALIASDVPCAGAAVFTTNKFQAAPVQVSRKVLEIRHGAGIRAIVINSGCANAVTGKGGVDDAEAMGGEVDKCYQDKDDGKGGRTLVMSTGVIGQRLPIQKICSKIPDGHSNLEATHNSWLTTARSIMTTDTFPKLLSMQFKLPSTGNSVTYSIAGMTKGAGMIHPNMATLLGILCTDAPISPPALHTLLTSAVNRSFNSISIDGDTSTNDTVAILANGLAAPPLAHPIPNDINSPDFAAMSTILTGFAQSLSQLVVRDGEGATKFVTVNVRSAPTYKDAHAVASMIARSPLVKTALYGKDANWGRILCAIGYTPSISPGAVVPERTSVSFVPTPTSASKDEGVLKLLVNGEPEAVDEARASRLLQDEDLQIEVNLGTGTEDATYWFCDFSHEYVTINGDYRT